jgi:hypothetical protein
MKNSQNAPIIANLQVMVNPSLWVAILLETWLIPYISLIQHKWSQLSLHLNFYRDTHVWYGHGVKFPSQYCNTWYCYLGFPWRYMYACELTPCLIFLIRMHPIWRIVQKINEPYSDNIFGRNHAGMFQLQWNQAYHIRVENFSHKTWRSNLPWISSYDLTRFARCNVSSFHVPVHLFLLVWSEQARIVHYERNLHCPKSLHSLLSTVILPLETKQMNQLSLCFLTKNTNTC